MFKFKLAEAFVEMTAKDGGLVRTITGVDQQMHRLSSSVARVAAVGAALTGIAAPFIAGAKYASDYQDALTRLQLKFRQLTDRDLKEHKKSVDDIALAYGESRTEVLSLATEMTSASGSLRDSFQVIEAGAKIAASGIAPLGEAVGTVDALLSNFGLSAADAERVADKLLATNTRAQGSFQELATVIGNLAPTAGTAKVNLDEFLASVATLSRSRDPSRVQSLGEALRFVAHMTESTGDSAKDAAKEVLSNVFANEGWFAVLRRLAREGDVVQKTLLAGKGYESVASLVKELSHAQEDLTVITNASGQAQGAAELGTERFRFQVERAWTAVKSLHEVVGERLLPTITALTKRVADSGSELLKWAKSHGEVIDLALRGVASLAAFAATLVVVKVAAAGAGLALTLVTSPLLLIATLAGGVTTAMVLLGDESEKSGKRSAAGAELAEKAWKSFLSWLQPSIGTAIVTLATFPAAAELFVTKAQRMFSRIKDYLGHAGDWISDAFKFGWDTMQYWLGRISDRVWAFLQDLGDLMKAGLRGLFSVPFSEAEKQAGEDFDSAWKRLKENKTAPTGEAPKFKTAPLPLEDSAVVKAQEEAQKKFDREWDKAQARMTRLFNPAARGPMTPQEWLANRVSQAAVTAAAAMTSVIGYRAPERGKTAAGEDASTPQSEGSLSRALKQSSESVTRAVSDIVAAPELWRKVQTAVLSGGPQQTEQDRLLNDLKREITKQSEYQRGTRDNTAKIVDGIPAYPQ